MKGIKISALFLTLCSTFYCAAAFATNETECVILLHGLGRSHCSMSPLESELKKHDYVVVNHNYPSTKKSIDEIAFRYLPPMINECLGYHPSRIHFVTHSIGGVILQRYLQKNTISNLDNIVMMGPPNHGSPWVDAFNKTFIGFILGPSIKELSIKKNSAPPLARHYKIGVIAGTYNINPLGYMVFNEPNDGKVGVSSTKIKWMHDFIALPVTHTFMMRNAEVEEEILYFLKHGKFLHKTA